MLKKYKPYIIEILIALAVGGLSAYFTKNSMADFEALVKPPLSPPGFLFPIVWAILFTLMGISAGMVYKSSGSVPFIYRLSLIVNFFWSIIFFNMEAYLFAFIWLLLLLVLIILTIIEYSKINKTAAYLQIPYLVWVAFAGYLNFFIWLLN
ncbi:MAG: tryptophan-rich sensory protein [Clostridia bacterium]|nr:tryptophan-rich sensory protein [Clostridia bacterium]